MSDDLFTAVLHSTRSTYRLMERLGVHTMLGCSTIATDTVDDDVAAQHLHDRRLAWR